MFRGTRSKTLECAACRLGIRHLRFGPVEPLSEMAIWPLHFKSDAKDMILCFSVVFNCGMPIFFPVCSRARVRVSVCVRVRMYVYRCMLICVLYVNGRPGNSTKELMTDS